ncbi:Serine/threonine-protein kinase-like protein [Hapsidospora chrysogenum ATCC 11550]|uniref:mitogen-activated protein kinase n=1 Tax=Hapsidospora chrysogenum (strain ATCC 11550 / CBS 779.69 / DSM 880 / IAM 14645 / JCM 23072 / IMI 49137) TaxID=857340 RepID=A0A086T673_HAPC1|nr:Serine/threonine-protein kinase-like protein [Hapsidospora chrysogenum ATCC 11550]
MDLDSTVVMFYDKSRGQTCQVYGEGAFPFAHDRPRRVVVGPKINTIIGIGGLARDLLRFELQWHCEEDEVAASVKKIRETPYLDDDPRFARTIDEADTVPSSRMPTRIHTPGPQSLKVRYVEVCRLGRGQFGEVHKGLDIDSGKFIAVKKIPAPTTGFHEEWTKLKREIEILSSLSHDHIVNFISFQGLGGPEVEIIMGLKDGSLASLMRGTHSDVQNIVDTVLHHILQALDCLAAQGIIHRDVKPENILYVSRQGRFHYLLGDFGLSNRQISSTSQCGSALYAAPEVHETGEQTPKADVWSLFITILWVSNTHGFREASRTFKCFPDVRRAVLSAAPHLPSIQEMARVDPVERASAAQMLVKCYEGRGLISPRSHVPPLENLDPVSSKASTDLKVIVRGQDKPNTDFHKGRI